MAIYPQRSKYETVFKNLFLFTGLSDLKDIKNQVLVITINKSDEKPRRGGDSNLMVQQFSTLQIHYLNKANLPMDHSLNG
jgi:hypothetical protein